MADPDSDKLAKVYPECAADLAQYQESLISDGYSKADAASITREVRNELVAFYDALEPARATARRLRAIRDGQSPK
jgi:hypothetical protein